MKFLFLASVLVFLCANRIPVIRKHHGIFPLKPPLPLERPPLTEWPIEPFEEVPYLPEVDVDYPVQFPDEELELEIRLLDKWLRMG